MVTAEKTKTLSLLDFISETHGTEAAAGVAAIFVRRNAKQTNEKDKFMPAAAGSYSIGADGVITMPDPRHPDRRDDDITITPKDNGEINVEFVSGMSMVTYAPPALAAAQQEKNASAIAGKKDQSVGMLDLINDIYGPETAEQVRLFLQWKHVDPPAAGGYKLKDNGVFTIDLPGLGAMISCRPRLMSEEDAEIPPATGSRNSGALITAMSPPERAYKLNDAKQKNMLKTHSFLDLVKYVHGEKTAESARDLLQKLQIEPPQGGEYHINDEGVFLFFLDDAAHPIRFRPQELPLEDHANILQPPISRQVGDLVFTAGLGLPSRSATDDEMQQFNDIFDADGIMLIDQNAVGNVCYLPGTEQSVKAGTLLILDETAARRLIPGMPAMNGYEGSPQQKLYGHFKERFEKAWPPGADAPDPELMRAYWTEARKLVTQDTTVKGSLRASWLKVHEQDAELPEKSIKSSEEPPEKKKKTVGEILSEEKNLITPRMTRAREHGLN